MTDRLTYMMKKFEQEIESEQNKELNLQEEDEYEIQVKKRFPFIRNIMTLYDRRTLILIALTFFNEGAEFMMILAVTIQFLTLW